MPQVSVVFNLYPFSDDLFLPNAYIVSVESSGIPTHIVQKATRDTIASYDIPLAEPLSALFPLLEALQPKVIEARFKPPKSRQTPTLTNLIADAQTKPTVLKYIHEQLDRLLQLVVRHQLPLALDAEKRTLVKDVLLSMPAEDQIPHIAFRKTDAGMEYRLQLGTELAPWRISQRGVTPLTNTDPAWLVAGYTLLHVPGINGYMVKPFQQKDVVHIPPDKVQLYFRQFITKAAGRSLIDAEGFDLAVSNTLQHIRLEPVEHLLENTWYLKPVFVYDGAEFAWGDKKTQVTTVHFDAEGRAALHQVRRDQPSEEAGLARLLALSLDMEGRLLKPYGQSGINTCLQWLAENREALGAAGFVVKPLTLDGKVLALDAPSIHIETAADGDWFDVQGRVAVGKHHFPFKSLAPWIRKGDPYYPLPDGTFFRIPEEWFARYSELVSEAADGPGDALRVRKALFTLLDKAGVSPSEGVRFTLVDPEQVAFDVPTELRATLRPYQLTGVKWLVGHYREGFGACLADDMGLGKTLQTIALLLHVKSVTATSVADLQPLSATKVADLQRPSATKVADTGQLNLFQAYQELLRPLNALIILPASLVFNWQQELHRFAPTLFTYRHTGIKRLKDARALAAHDVVLTTYHTARQDLALLGQVRWRVMVLDESQYIKNRSSEISKVVRHLQGGYKISLSGTPIENSLADLWTQMEFINPDTLGSYAEFREQFQAPIEKKQDEGARRRLFERVQPFFLRRTKEEVAPDLPPLGEHIFYTEMAPEQHKRYEKIKSAARNEILSLFDDPKTRLQALQALMRLRQLANHPALIDTAYDGESGKFNDVWSQWEVVRKSNHKVLFFSSFEKHLRLFRTAFEQAGFPFAWLTGDTPTAERAVEVKRFQDDPTVQAFFITVKAGGVGLNLTAADYVFVLDPWWNPAAESQAIARAHRIGQTRPVTALRFISRESIEEKIVLLQDRKKALGQALFAGDAESPSLTREDMALLLS